MSPDPIDKERTRPLAGDAEETPSATDAAPAAEGASEGKDASAGKSTATYPRGAGPRRPAAPPQGTTSDHEPPDDTAPDPTAAEAAEAAEVVEAAEAAEAAAEQTVRDAISVPDGKGRARRATRRFPLFTRDTARPEGGGRAAPGDAPAPARQWPMLTVLGIAALGLLITAFDLFRAGTLLIGAALLAGAALRWVLPGVGMLAVRSRFTDIVTYGVLGGAIVLLAMMAQPHPLLEIPFLKDTLHFTLNN